MASQQINSANPLANPNNSIEVSNDVTCGCGTPNLCQANFNYVYDSVADTVTVTGLSFIDLAGGDLISGANAVVNVSDAAQPTPVDVTQASATGEAADIVADVSTLDTAEGTWKITYTVTTDNGCVSSIVLFFDPLVANQATGSSDPYSAER